MVDFVVIVVLCVPSVTSGVKGMCVYLTCIKGCEPMLKNIPSVKIFLNAVL